MGLVRVSSAFVLFHTSSEFLKDPKNLDELIFNSSDVMNDMYEWGHDRFMGIPQNTTQVQLKKSARQIFSEAFMDDDASVFMGGNNRRMYQYDDEEAEQQKEASTDDQEIQDDEDLIAEEVNLDEQKEVEEIQTQENAQALLDSLFDDDEDDEEEE